MPSKNVSDLAKYLAKIERRVQLSPEARAAFLAIPTEAEDHPAYRNIVNEGDRPKRASLVDHGLVSRYKTLKNGLRQIMSFHIPGDFVDLQSAMIVVADHAIRTHCPTRIITVAHEDILMLTANVPELARAFWFDTLVDAAIFREWTLNVGRRNSRQRTAHLLLELSALYDAAGLVVNETFHFPITQNDLADALGMTAVHLNRVLQSMRGDRLIRTHSRFITIEDRTKLTELAGFNAGYLHPEGPRHISALEGHFVRHQSRYAQALTAAKN